MAVEKLAVEKLGVGKFESWSLSLRVEFFELFC